YKSSDPIPGQLRFEWMKEEFQNESSIKPEISLDDFDNEELSFSERMPLWTEFIKKRFPTIDIVISSENYGIELAEALAIKHISFDPERKRFPVSASSIRKRPFHYW